MSLDLQVADLTQFKIFPSSLSEVTLTLAEKRLRQSLAGHTYPELGTDLPILTSLPKIVEDIGAGLSQILYLSGYLRRVISDLPTNRTGGRNTLVGMARYVDLEVAAKSGVPDAVWPTSNAWPGRLSICRLSAGADSIEMFLEDLGSAVTAVPVPAEPALSAVISAWSESVPWCWVS